RTSALHVARMRIVGRAAGKGDGSGPAVAAAGAGAAATAASPAAGGGHPRAILEVTVPRGSGPGARPLAVRLPVRDYALVKDTSGRTERRPVIETTLRLGSVERRIRITLTNRGDMLFP